MPQVQISEVGSRKSEKQKGFTLVELLVVISIIAILAVIGMTVFSGVQKSGRDAKRKADIDAIAKAMEANYSNETGQYKALAGDMFAQGAVPTDSLNGQDKCLKNSSRCKYCITTVQTCTQNDSEIAAGVPGAVSTFKICANLEDSDTAYCRSNQR